jgi:cytochrome c556
MLLSLLLLLFVAVSGANAKDKKAELMKDMKTMLEAMEEIQSGGLYSCGDCMKKGVKKLQKTLSSLESEDVKEILPKGQEYAYKFAQKTARMLRLYSNDLVESVNANRMDDALEDYTQLLKQCTSCHIRIRNW